MKATLEFDLNDSDDIMAHFRAVKSLDMSLAIWEILHNTKNKVLYEVEQKQLDGYDSVELVYEKIYEQLKGRNINLDEMIE